MIESSSCPILSVEQSHLLHHDLVFYVEGVLLMGVSSVGIVLNAIFALVLGRKELSNSFNRLLMCLALIDSCYLLLAFLESLRRGLNVANNVHLLLFPKLLYPMQGVALSASILMTVAISVERHGAVHNPVHYNRAMNDPQARRRRTVRFLLPVLLLAVLVSLPRFFEATIVYEDGLKVRFTDFRIHPTFARCISYVELMVQGVLPVLLLVHFNSKVYMEVMERRRRLRPSWISSKMTYLQIPLAKLSKKEIKECSTWQHCDLGATSTWSSTASSHRRRRKEDRLALLFITIVLAFLACFTSRIVLAVYETIQLDTIVACSKMGVNALPAWVWLLTSMSNLMVAINSAINMPIYCLWNNQFRASAKNLFARILNKKNDVNSPDVQSKKELMEAPICL